MAFRSAGQRFRLVQRPLVSRISRVLAQATEQSRHASQRQKEVTSSWPLVKSAAPCRSFSQKLHSCEPWRALNTGFRSEVEERKQSLDATAGSPREALSSEAPGNISDSSQFSSSVNIAIESAYASSPRHDLAMLFTCTVCETRSAKTMSRSSYETGVVIVRCPGCNNLHLIADRYGWFGERGGVEDFLAEKGVDIRTGSDSSYEFTMEDLAGWTRREKPEKE